jgi:chromosome segregation protein
MFKLQRLEITGFKSFADYTEILFTGRGITAVVGPNGCGKSNVSDAISWVLGEQRPTSLRGQEMKDVVFQGTSKRSPSGMAEVVLHLVRDDGDYASDESELEDIDEKLGEIDAHAVDIEGLEVEEAEDEFAAEAISDEDAIGEEEEAEEAKVKAAQVGSVTTIEKKVRSKRRWRPRNFALEFAPGEAVTVTRRLYLSGESEYLLNNRTCRLRDIQDLFSGTGLSGAHYAIIEQGRIGQILSSKPSNRRTLIEEAAGISKFRMRQRAAETRLASAKLNLGRITDIVSEIEKQTRTLRRQASKTRRYKVLREELRSLLRQTYAAEGAHLSGSVTELNQLLEKAVKNERESFDSVSTKDEAFRSATGLAREAEDRVTEVRAKHAANALERDRTVREHEYQKARIRELTARSTTLGADLRATRERIEGLVKEVDRLQKEEIKERKAAEKEKARLKEAETVYADKLEILNEREKSLEAERSEHLQHNAAVERLNEIGRQFESNLERLGQRTEGLEREYERAGQTLDEREEEHSGLEKEVTEGRAKLDSLNKEKQGILGKTEKSKEILGGRLEVLSALSDKHAAARHRLDTLRELEEKKAIYSPSVQKVFSEQNSIGVKFIGTLADGLKVDKKAEIAVENLFGSNLQSILVKDASDARKTVEYLNRNQMGRIGVLVVEKTGASLNGGPLKGSVGAELGASPELSAALIKAFPREMSARLVEDLKDAESAKEEIVASFEGDIVAGGKIYIRGRTPAKEKNVSILGFKRELSELEKSSNEIASKIGSAEKDVEAARAELAGHEDKLVDLQSLIVKIERELLSKEVHIKSLTQEIERAGRHKRVVADEIEQNVAEIDQLEKRKKEAAENAKIAGKALALTEEKIKGIGVEIAKARKVVDDENEVLNRKRTFAEVAAERQRSVNAALERVSRERAELESRAERQASEISETDRRVAELAESSAALNEEIKKTAKEIDLEEEELKAAIAHLSTAREKSDSMSEELAALNKVAAEARDARAGLEIRKTESVSGLRNLREKCSEDLNLTLEELIEKTPIDDDFDFEESRKRVRDLRNRLDNFGAINMLALEELSETEERLEFLSSQMQDVVDSITATEEALREIKKRSRERFRAAFEAINANFSEFFRELFGGGSGEMVLMESDDVLDAGVEIVAQPPGKRLQNMLLLSGGEKAMTAIALVLAIFRYRPSPFCLLDEVDAPLDDANVGRFVGRIDEMSENTQFIVITHNKSTMEAAKALYGVTMQEAGVSRVVSVRFE